MMRWLTLAFLFLTCGSLVAADQSSTPFSPERAGFVVACEPGISLEYKVQPIFVLPEETIRMHSESQDLVFFTQAGSLRQVEGAWYWQAPAQPGIYSGRFSRTGTQETLQVGLVVLVPAGRVRNGRLNQYPLGFYPEPQSKPWNCQSPPRGFVEVTSGNQETWLTPHFQLKQFLCKQNSRFPKYVCLDEKLLVKLELLAENLHIRFGSSRLVIMSGYRTPAYNRALGDAKYSAHLWGQAADLYVDDDDDGVMDDLNHDQRHDSRDAQLVYEVADALDTGGLAEVSVGGLGVYDQTKAHGPFVHVDTRGYRARWGLLPNRQVARAASNALRPE